MLSLYIHIPFCDRKCEYCNFFVIAKDSPNWQENMIEQYLVALHHEIDHRAWLTGDQQIKSIYFWWGTPGILSLTQLTGIIDHIVRLRDCQYLEELSIELNPDPFEHTLELVQWLSNAYKNFPRIRYSFGIQTFDDAILKQSGRGYIFNNVRHFLRQLREIKQSHNVFNLDFISFGTRDTWSQPRKDFLENMIHSLTFDSYSLYLLELFPGSKWHSMLNKTNLSPLLSKLVNPDEDAIMTEYDMIADILYGAWYTQYEVSNRSLAGKDSIHNHVYRNMQSYLGLGTSASGLLDRTRSTNTSNLASYLKGDYIDIDKMIILSDHDFYIEKLMLALRTRFGISELSGYHAYLSSNRQDLVTERKQQWRARYESDHLILTHDGMKIANHLISDLLDFSIS